MQETICAEKNRVNLIDGSGEVDILIGNPAKAKATLGWTPTTLFEDLVKEMVASDLAEMDSGNIERE